MKLDQLLYGIEEAAQILGISKHTIARDIRRGLIASRPYGRRRLIPRDELFRIAAMGVVQKPAALPAPAGVAHA